MLCAIVCTLNRQTELERLVSWAERKRLPGPRRLYQRRLADEEMRLTHYALRFPRQLFWAHLVHRLSNLISTLPRYPARGSAATYRYGKS
jgi:hypothetical protein